MWSDNKGLAIRAGLFFQQESQPAISQLQAGDVEEELQINLQE